MSSAEGFQTTLGCVPPGGTGGGGTPPCDPSWDPSCSPADESGSGTCNPHTNPDCLQRLSLWDKQTIALAFARHRRTVFTDPNAEQMCNLLVTQFNQLLASGSVYRGGFTSTGEPNDRFHVAAYDPAGGTIHFEPNALGAANAGDPAAIRSIFNSALHEAAHSLNYQHTEPVWSGTYDLYAETPFNLLSPGANSCITNS